jgi:hypothetical protein
VSLVAVAVIQNCSTLTPFSKVKTKSIFTKIRTTKIPIRPKSGALTEEPTIHLYHSKYTYSKHITAKVKVSESQTFSNQENYM